MRLEVKGLTGLIANVRATQPRVQREILNEVRRYATNTKVDAQLRARVKTGKMRDGIRDTYSEQGRVARVGWEAGEFTTAGQAFYPVFHEFGTSRMSAEPMIRPAHARHAPVLERNIGEIMRRSFQGLGR
jgi:HK97 gp10 family phage protein